MAQKGQRCTIDPYYEMLSKTNRRYVLSFSEFLVYISTLKRLYTGDKYYWGFQLSCVSERPDKLSTDGYEKISCKK